MVFSHVIRGRSGGGAVRSSGRCPYDRFGRLDHPAHLVSLLVVFGVSGSQVLSTAPTPAGISTTGVTSHYHHPLLTWAGTVVHADHSLPSDLQMCPPVQ